MQEINAVDQHPLDATPKLARWAEQHASIRAMLITSTRAIPGASTDILSDYDVILVVEDIHPWVEDHAWLEDFGEVLVGYWDPIHPDRFFGIDVCGNVIQYADGLKIDFTLWPVKMLQQIVRSPALPKELEAGYKILVDKDHFTEGLLLPTGRGYIPGPPSIAEYQTLINDFLSDAPYVAKCLWRDELMPAKWCLDYDMKHIYLRQVLEWLVELDQNWSLPVGALGKGLKKRLPPEIWTDLEKTYTGANISENWKALLRTLKLFRMVAKTVGTTLGYQYPEELHQRVTQYVNRIRHMSPDG